jgi:hypothetical protein
MTDFLESRAFLVCAWLLIAGALVYGGASSFARITGQGVDFNVFYMAGRIAASDHPGTMYEEHAARGDAYTYIYLPCLAVMMVPLAVTPLAVSAVVWFLLNVAFTLHAAWLLAAGLARDSRQRPAFVTWILLLTIGFTVENLLLGQVHAFLLWLMTCSWHLLRKGRGTAGATMMAVATAVKLLPGVFGLYFLLRREWRNLTAFVVVFSILAFAVPYAVFDRATATRLLGQFYAIQVAPYLVGESGSAGNASIYRRTAVRKTLHDQDLGALLQRHFTADNGLVYGDRDFSWLNLVAWPTSSVRKAVFACFLLFVAILVAVILRCRRRIADRILAGDVEFSLFTMMSLLLAPRNRVAYMTVFLIPFAVLLATARRGELSGRARAAARATVAGGFVLTAFMVAPLFKALSFGFYGTLWIWTGLLVVCARAAARGAARSPTSDSQLLNPDS